jgi:histone H3/H4
LRFAALVCHNIRVYLLKKKLDKIACHFSHTRMARTKTTISGAKGLKKPISGSKPTGKAEARHPVVGGKNQHQRQRHRQRTTIIPVTVMYRFIKRAGTKLGDSQKLRHVRVSRKAAQVAVNAIEDVADTVLRDADKLMTQLTKKKTLSSEHLMVAFENWSRHNLKVAPASKRLAPIYGCVNNLELRRRATHPASSVHKSKTGEEALAAAMRQHNAHVEDDDDDDDEDHAAQRKDKQHEAVQA